MESHVVLSPALYLLGVFLPGFLLKSTFHCTEQEGNVAGHVRSKGHQVGSQQYLYPSLPTRHGSNSSPHPHYQKKVEGGEEVLSLKDTGMYFRISVKA